MHGTMENRAAVFTSSPQDVEVYRDGGWWAGSLLGWRHDAAGGCQVWVRVVVRGAEETSWLALDQLRLPEPAALPELSVIGTAAPAGSGADAAMTGTMAAIRAVPAPRSRDRAMPVGSLDPTATLSMVAVRDSAGDGPVTPPRAGGRRRAPEQPDGREAENTVAGILARHRAPGAAGSAGRHRAADTGGWPAVRDEAPVQLCELPRPSLSARVPDEPDSHLLTRPMRLGNPLDGGAVPQPRRASLEARLTGV